MIQYSKFKKQTILNGSILKLPEMIKQILDFWILKFGIYLSFVNWNLDFQLLKSYF